MIISLQEPSNDSSIFHVESGKKNQYKSILKHSLFDIRTKDDCLITKKNKTVFLYFLPDKEHKSNFWYPIIYTHCFLKFIKFDLPSNCFNKTIIYHNTKIWYLEVVRLVGKQVKEGVTGGVSRNSDRMRCLLCSCTKRTGDVACEGVSFFNLKWVIAAWIVLCFWRWEAQMHTGVIGLRWVE